MLVMTYSDARANFSALLNRVKAEGAAIVKRADGSAFRITVEEPKGTSPFDGIRPTLAHIPMDEILDIIHESHERA